MSHFYASVQGNRGQANRCGSKKSGMWGHIRGWNVGCLVECRVDEKGKDVVSVYQTGGSNNSSSKLIATLKEE